MRRLMALGQYSIHSQCNIGAESSLVRWMEEQPSTSTSGSRRKSLDGHPFGDSKASVCVSMWIVQLVTVAMTGRLGWWGGREGRSRLIAVEDFTIIWLYKKSISMSQPFSFAPSSFTNALQWTVQWTGRQRRRLRNIPIRLHKVYTRSPLPCPVLSPH